MLGGDIVVAGNKKVLAAVKHGADQDDHQHGGIPARRFHPQRGFLAADRTAEAGDHVRCRQRATSPSSMRRGSLTALLGNSIAGNIFMVGYA